MRAQKLTLTALTAALCCVIAPISIPIGPVPVSLSLLAVLLTAALSGAGRGVAAVGIYIVLGALGLPVFAGFTGGIERIAGVTGGFIVGYLPCALIVGLLTRGVDVPRWRYPVGMALGTLACYLCGCVWFAVVSRTDILTALTVSVLPFILPDALKIAAASLLAVRLRKALAKINK